MKIHVYISYLPPRLWHSTMRLVFGNNTGDTRDICHTDEGEQTFGSPLNARGDQILRLKK